MTRSSCAAPCLPRASLALRGTATQSCIGSVSSQRRSEQRPHRDSVRGFFRCLVRRRHFSQTRKTSKHRRGDPCSFALQIPPGGTEAYHFFSPMISFSFSTTRSAAWPSSMQPLSCRKASTFSWYAASSNCRTLFSSISLFSATGKGVLSRG